MSDFWFDVPAVVEVPVGRSFEVKGSDVEHATANAYLVADAGGMISGRVLYAEQLSAGTWEIVLEDVG